MMGGGVVLLPSGRGERRFSPGCHTSGCNVVEHAQSADIQEKRGTPTELSKDDVLCGTDRRKHVSDNSSSSIKKPERQNLGAELEKEPRKEEINKSTCWEAPDWWQSGLKISFWRPLHPRVTMETVDCLCVPSQIPWGVLSRMNPTELPKLTHTRTAESPPAHRHTHNPCTCLRRRSVWSLVPLTASPREWHPHRLDKTLCDVSGSWFGPPGGLTGTVRFQKSVCWMKSWRSFRINKYSLHWSHHQFEWNWVQMWGRRLWWESHKH